MRNLDGQAEKLDGVIPDNWSESVSLTNFLSFFLSFFGLCSFVISLSAKHCIGNTGLLTLSVCFICVFTGRAFQLYSASGHSIQLHQGKQLLKC